MSAFNAGQRFRTAFQIPQADLLGPVITDVQAADDGAIIGFGVVVQTAITTGGTLKLQTPTGAGGAMQDVPGSTITVPNGTAKGTIFQVNIPQGPDATKCARNSRVSVVPAGFASAGAVNGHITVGTQSNPVGV